MHALAFNTPLPPYRVMPLTRSPTRADQELTGKAIRQLRERSGLRQADIAAALDMSTQAWNKYEAGERKFTSEKLPVILDALHVTEEELDAERQRVLGRTPPNAAGDSRPADPFLVEMVRPNSAELERPNRQLDLRQLLGPGVGALQVAEDSMAPWAEPGETILFDRDRYPRRGHGCVVELKDGTFLPRLYEGSDGSTLFVRVLHPEPRTTQIQHSQVRGIYAVTLRGD